MKVIAKSMFGVLVAYSSFYIWAYYSGKIPPGRTVHGLFLEKGRAAFFPSQAPNGPKAICWDCQPEESQKDAGG